MAIFQNNSPASMRSGTPAARENRSVFAPDPRPYLVTGPRRKPIASTQQYLALFPHESEDARLTGSTRSLYRRLLALNLPGALARVEPSAADLKSEIMEVVFNQIKPGSSSATKIA
jgi:hypothetical protein